MAIKLGSTDISKLYLGSTEVSKAYLGSTQVYPVATANPFEFRVTIPSNGYTLSLPYNSIGTYSGTIDFGDGSASVTNSFANRSHTYATAGDYNIKIDGECSRFQYQSHPDRLLVKEILSWGIYSFDVINFNGCKNFIGGANCLDVINLNTTNLFQLFYDCENMVSIQFMEDWDVSNITLFFGIFYDNNLFNQNLTGWDTSSATDLSDLFRNAAIYNQPVNSFDVSNVTSLRQTFAASSFNQSLSSWDVSNVTTLQTTFYNSDFNQPINNWNVSNVTNMFFTFALCPFNQPLNNWNTSSVTNMRRMFYINSAFSYDVSAWDVSNVTRMDEMFRSATSFDHDLSAWDLSSCTNMTNFMNGKSSANFSAANCDAIFEACVNGGQSNVNLGMGTIKYSSAGATDRATLISRGWTITDGGQV
jgi:surface protein